MEHLQFAKMMIKVTVIALHCKGKGQVLFCIVLVSTLKESPFALYICLIFANLSSVQVIPSVFSGSLADATRKQSVLVGTDVTLSCLFDKLSKQVEWSTLTVEWNMADKRAEKKVVYTLVDGTAHVNRDGSVVDKSRLLESDASLQLHNVTVRDEGLYTCRIITPVVYTETTSLEVLGILL